MANESTIDQLARLDFFDGFSREELGRVAELSEEVDAEPGAELTDQGQTGDVAYVILEGTASVTVAGNKIATCEPGDPVGEMSLLSHKPRNATVTADTDMRLIALDTRKFKALLDENPRMHERITHELNERVRQQNRNQ